MIIKMFFPRAQQFEKVCFFFFFLLAYFRKLALGHDGRKKTQRIYFYMKIICFLLIFSVLKLLKHVMIEVYKAYRIKLKKSIYLSFNFPT